MSTTTPLPVRAELRRQGLFAAWAMQQAIFMHSSAVSALLAACRRIVRSALADWRDRRQIRATRLALMNLDDATLRDIGCARAEIESVAAEAHGAVAVTRTRLLAQAGPGAH